MSQLEGAVAPPQASRGIVKQVRRRSVKVEGGGVMRKFVHYCSDNTNPVCFA